MVKAAWLHNCSSIGRECEGGRGFRGLAMKSRGPQTLSPWAFQGFVVEAGNREPVRVLRFRRFVRACQFTSDLTDKMLKPCAHGASRLLWL